MINARSIHRFVSLWPSLDVSRLKLCLAVFFLMIVVGSATSCVYPCNPSSDCTHVDISSCEAGIVKDVCECCDVCGKALDQICGPAGKCGDGLVCVKGYEEGLTEEELRTYPSFCQLAPTTAEPNVTDSTSSSPTSSREPTNTTETAEPTSSTDIPHSTNTSNCTDSGSANQEEVVVETCREACSLDFCSSDRARICSAAGLEFKKIPRRNACQHTSCRACFLLMKANCSQHMCEEPPNKRCLRSYYECIRDFYFLNPEPVFLSLNDARAAHTPGNIVCHVPEVQEDTWTYGR